MALFMQTALLFILIGLSKNCKLPGSNLQSLWMEFPPLVMLNISEPDRKSVHGALVTGLSSMLNTCCHLSVTINWDITALNVEHLETSFNDKHDFALPITRTLLFQSFANNMPSMEYIPLLETQGPMLLKDDEKSSNAVFMAVLGTWPMLMLLLSSAAIAGVIMWALDRISNPDMFPPSFLKGFWEGLWWAYVTMTTVGYGDKTPTSVAGRLFGFIWIIVGIVMISIFTATLATAFTQDNGIALRGLNIGVLNASTEYLFAYAQGARTKEYSTINDLINAIKEDDSLDGILVDSFFGLQHFNLMDQNQLGVQGFLHNPATHGVLFQAFDADVTRCLWRESLKVKFSVHEDLINRIGHITQKSKGDDVWKKSSSLTRSNMEMTYAFAGIWLGVFLIMVAWEFLYWRPRNLVNQLPTKNETKEHNIETTKT